MYDTIIIGGGIAGLTAALYAERRAMKTLLLTKDLGGQINWAGEIANYPGFDLISAFELNQRLTQQAKLTGYTIIMEEVKKITVLPDHNFEVATKEQTYQARTVIFALGLIPRRLNIPGEKEFAGKGVSYCANCDGPFFKGKRVAVVGGGNSALDAAETLAHLASEVHLIHRQDSFNGFESLVEAAKACPNITFHMSSEVVSVNGAEKVTSLTIKDKTTTIDLALDGLFIEIGRSAQSDLVADLVDRDDHQQIIVDSGCRTNLPGFFAIGDITNTEHKQLSVAAGMGTIAALNAYKYLRGS